MASRNARDVTLWRRVFDLYPGSNLVIPHTKCCQPVDDGLPSCLMAMGGGMTIVPIADPASIMYKVFIPA